MGGLGVQPENIQYTHPIVCPSVASENSPVHDMGLLHLSLSNSSQLDDLATPQTLNYRYSSLLIEREPRNALRMIRIMTREM